MHKNNVRMYTKAAEACNIVVSVKNCSQTFIYLFDGDIHMHIGLCAVHAVHSVYGMYCILHSVYCMYCILHSVYCMYCILHDVRILYVLNIYCMY